MKDPKKSKTPKKVLVIFGCFLVLVFLTIITLISIYYDSYSYPNDYAIVIDAGSSGSRTYVYSWKSGLSAYKGDNVQVEQIFECNKKDGIDRLRSKDEVILYFNDCLQQASKNIPNERKNRAYIILAATAGMRLLNITNKDQSDKILGYIRDHFSRSEFLYKSDNQVQIIDGKDEGLYGWISANYFANKFSTNVDPSTTIGTLDLGGASTQISFLPSSQGENSSVMDNYFKKLRIYGTDYRTYSTSFLCWGTNQIILIYQTYLIIKNGYKQDADSACFNSKISLNITTASLLDSPCSNGNLFKFSPGIELEKLKQRDFYKINGISDPNKCEQELAILFPDATCQFGDGMCSFNNMYLPRLNNKNKFYAFSSYYYQMVNSEQLAGKKLQDNFNEYVSETKRLCSLNYDQLSDINNKLKPIILDEYLQTTCFYNLYITKLLAKFKITSFENVEILNKINNFTIGWTLGYMIDLINRQEFLPFESPPRKLQSEIFIPIIIICVIFSILALGLVLFSIFSM